MKIAFFTEASFEGKVPRDHPNLRTDLAWQAALKAEHHSIHSTSWFSSGYDLGIIIVPKKQPEAVFRVIDHVREICSITAVMQEGSHTLWQDYSIENQIEYLNLISNVDILYCHNDIDKVYFEGLIDHKDVRKLPPLILEDSIKNEYFPERNGVMVGGTWCSWYSGQDSYMVAKHIDEPIYAPSMGRKQEQEDQIDGITYIPYMDFSKWIQEMGKRKYAVHLMRTYAAGTFALLCGRLQIPCVGYKSLDTQHDLFLNLSVTEGDLGLAKDFLQALKQHSDFYENLTNRAFDIYWDVYSEDAFLKRFFDGF